ncbi:MAG: hypothetical protein WAV94_02205, partial [Trichococcus flocculiformis]
AEILPEVAENPVREYQFLKYQVAKKWIATDLADFKWYTTDETVHDSEIHKPAITTLRLECNYDFWSYKDIIDLRLPSIIRHQIDSEKINLLEWFNENTPDTITKITE